jgi:hypothetical protein
MEFTVESDGFELAQAERPVAKIEAKNMAPTHERDMRVLR